MIARTALLLDFDDTIFNTTGYKALRDEYYKQKFDEKFWQRFKKYEHDYATGQVKTFNLPDVLTDKELSITNRHLKEIAPSLLYEDFKTFIGKIDDDHFFPMILTFGEKELQDTKIAAVGIDLPIIHTESKNKTEVIGRWRSHDSYHINGSDFKKVVLIDDRQSNFVDFDKLPNARGFLVQRAGVDPKFDLDSLPKNVSVVSGLDEISLDAS